MRHPTWVRPVVLATDRVNRTEGLRRRRDDQRRGVPGKGPPAAAAGSCCASATAASPAAATPAAAPAAPPAASPLLPSPSTPRHREAAGAAGLQPALRCSPRRSRIAGAKCPTRRAVARLWLVRRGFRAPFRGQDAAKSGNQRRCAAGREVHAPTAATTVAPRQGRLREAEAQERPCGALRAVGKPVPRVLVLFASIHCRWEGLGRV